MYCLYILYIIAVPSVCPSWTRPTIRSNVFVHYYALWVRVVSLEKNGVGGGGGRVVAKSWEGRGMSDSVQRGQSCSKKTPKKTCRQKKKKESSSVVGMGCTLQQRIIIKHACDSV